MACQSRSLRRRIYSKATSFDTIRPDVSSTPTVALLVRNQTPIASQAEPVDYAHIWSLRRSKERRMDPDAFPHVASSLLVRSIRRSNWDRSGVDRASIPRASARSNARNDALTRRFPSRRSSAFVVTHHMPVFFEHVSELVHLYVEPSACACVVLVDVSLDPCSRRFRSKRSSVPGRLLPPLGRQFRTSW